MFSLLGMWHLFTRRVSSVTVHPMKCYLALVSFVLMSSVTFVYAVPAKEVKEGNERVAEHTAPQELSDESHAVASEDAIGDLLLQAVSLLGVAYRFGGSTPASGLDCSGFIQYVFKKSLRIRLPRTAVEMSRLGKRVERHELVPGDLVFFNTRGFTFSHVGMYLGNSKFIHAPRTGKNIEVVSMNQAYWRGRYNGARRLDRQVYANAEAADEDIQLAAVDETALSSPTQDTKPVISKKALITKQRKHRPKRVKIASTAKLTSVKEANQATKRKTKQRSKTTNQAKTSKGSTPQKPSQKVKKGKQP